MIYLNYLVFLRMMFVFRFEPIQEVLVPLLHPLMLLK